MSEGDHHAAWWSRVSRVTATATTTILARGPGGQAAGSVRVLRARMRDVHDTAWGPVPS